MTTATAKSSPSKSKSSSSKPTSSSSGPSKNAKVVDDTLRIVDAKFVAGVGVDGGTFPPPTFTEIAFAGRSNVGKSSLINSLVERRGLVRTSSTPGCTRQVNLFEVKAKDGLTLVLADLPGYGFAKRSKAERKQWGELIEGYLQNRASLATIVILFDARRGLEPDDQELIDFARAPRERTLRKLDVVLVATKLDKVPRSQERSVLDRLKQTVGQRVLGYSAITGDARESVWRALRRSALGTGTPSGSDDQAAATNDSTETPNVEAAPDTLTD